jgi:hypothetical protein
MAATRFDHVGSAWSLPDASWAVFFVGGFYFARMGSGALAALLLEAVAVDYIAIRYYGVSNYCLTLAYWFIIPAYAVLWLGGTWMRRHCQQAPRDVVRLIASVVFAVSVCYLITQASFYWLGGRVAHPSVAGWWANFARWYGHFLTVSCTYVALAALAHIALTQRSLSKAALQEH